jgi:hypothetical protein
MDEYKRRIFLKNEVKKTMLRSIKRNKNATYSQRNLAAFYSSNLIRFSNQNMQINRCYVSGRS